MDKQYDEEKRLMAEHAVEDLQVWMANANADTPEAAVMAWQQGYIAGVNRAMGIKDGQSE